MNRLSKLIIFLPVLSVDWSWHCLSFWEIDGLNHSVIKYCPSGSTELSKYDRGVFSGCEIPWSLLGLFKRSEFARSPERVDHKPGSLKLTAGLPPMTMLPGHRISRIRWTKRCLPVMDRTWSGVHLLYSEYKSEAWTFFPGGVLNQFYSHVCHQMQFWKTGVVCNSPLKLPRYPNKVPLLWHYYLWEKVCLNCIFHRQRWSLMMLTAQVSLDSISSAVQVPRSCGIPSLGCLSQHLPEPGMPENPG